MLTGRLSIGIGTPPTFMLAGASDVSSFCIRSEIPGNIVVPPESTTLLYKSRRISISHLKMELYLHQTNKNATTSLIRTSLRLRRLVNTSGLKAEERRLEQRFGGTEP